MHDDDDMESDVDAGHATPSPPPTRPGTQASRAATNDVQLTSDLAAEMVLAAEGGPLASTAPPPVPTLALGPLPLPPQDIPSLPSMSRFGNEPEELPNPRRWRRVVETLEPMAVESDNAAINQPEDHSDATESEKAANSQLDNGISDSTTEDQPDTSDLPDHMVHLHAYLTREAARVDEHAGVKVREWGNVWEGCVREFVDFQRRANFPNTGPSFPPAAEVRPVQIATWMKNGRPWKDVEIDDEEVFGQQWWAWWLSLQPASRQRNDKPSSDMDWSKLQKPGRNGFQLIMLALVWWGVASNRDGEWLSVVADVKDVLQCMSEFAKEPVKEAGRHGPLTRSGAANTSRLVSSKRGCEGEAMGEGPAKKKRRSARFQ